MVQTINVANETPVGAFVHDNITLDISQLANGTHELFIRGYDIEGNISVFDMFLAHAEHGKYIPIVFEVDNALNINDKTKTTLQYYPNPVTKMLTVNLGGNYKKLQICTITGVVLKILDVTNQNEAKMDMSGYNSGLYFITIDDQQTIKVIKD